MGNSGSRIKWPPVVKSIDILGEIKETSGRVEHRDIGHSISLGGKRYYIFGDTFCYDDRGGFVGVTHNTIARIPDVEHPERSEYLNGNPEVPDFIPYFPAEKQFTDAPENKREHRRLVNWNFSNIIEDEPGSGTGWIFFDKVRTHGAEIEYEYGTDVARIEVSDVGDVHVERCSEDMLFRPEESRFGSISTLLDDDGLIYLLGGKGFKTHMARIRHGSDLRQRHNYEYLTSTGWKSTYDGAEELQNVLDDQMHGAMFKCPSNKFAPEGRPYIWFGVNKWLDNKVWLACAAHPEGPWDKQFLGEAPRLLGDDSGNRYCLYPHPWFTSLEGGEILLSWTDNGILGGIVGLAIYKFDIEAEEKKEDEK